jgi:cellulose biosynthesis protein BcsQ
MLLVIANNKGGQGKTFIATLLTFCLAANPKNAGNITCCDLDESQRNFTDNLRESGLPLVTKLPQKGADRRIWIVDTPPLLDASKEAIQIADILVVPVGLGKHAVHGLNRVAQIRGKKDLKVIINDWGGGLAQQKAESHLVSEGFNVIGRLGRYLRIVNNIDSHVKWSNGLAKQQADMIISVLLKILK